MTMLGVAVAVMEEGKILLTEREDFPIWCLPGGQVDDAESVAQAALREVYEEIGLEIELTRLVGVYSWPRWHDGGNHIVVFAARPLHAHWQLNPGEVSRAAYFAPQALPEPLQLMQGPAIRDALAGVGGSAVWTQTQAWPFPPELSRRDLYALRDQSGLSRLEFYFRHFPSSPEGLEQLEVGGPRIPPSSPAGKSSQGG